MAELTRFHRTRLLQPDIYKSDNDDNVIRPEFMDLYMKFLRNRVWITVDCKDTSEEEEERLSSLLESQILNALENRCTGFWTIDYKEDEKDQKVDIFIMFENEVDLEGFLANEAMVMRLAI